MGDRGSSPGRASFQIPASVRQCLWVSSAHWTDSHGRLSALERDARGRWSTVLGPIPASLGRAGLGWGRGWLGAVAESIPGPRKMEGDGRSPAGLFRVVSAFGEAPAAAVQTHLEYRQATARSRWVDDPRSSFYNQWVESTPGVLAAWQSAEEMLRTDGLYRWGLVIGHNLAPIEPGGGSAIFLHAWRGPKQPTSGCTAVAMDVVEHLVRWLDARAQPVLVQLTDEWVSLVEGVPPP